MNNTKVNFKIFAGAIMMTFSSLNNIYADEAESPTPSIDNEPIQKEVQVVNEKSENKPSIITPYAGFGIENDIDIKGAEDTSVDIDVSAYIGAKTKFDIDMVDKPVTADLKLKFSKDILSKGHKLAIKKAYINISEFQVGINKNIFLPSSRSVTAQIMWKKNFTDSISNTLGVESTNNETIFTKSLSIKKWDGAKDVVRWDSQPSGKVQKVGNLSDTGWFPMAFVEKVKYDADMVDVSLALLGKPIIYQQKMNKKINTKVDFGGGFAIDSTYKPIQDMTKIKMSIAFGRGIGSHLREAHKYESELVVRDQKNVNANKLVVPWGYSASIGITQYITPKKISVGLSYLLNSGGIKLGKMFNKYNKKVKATDKDFTSPNNGWKKLQTIKGSFDWDVNGDDKIEVSFEMNYNVGDKYPISLGTSLDVNFL